jgi:hypothetical protein
MPIGGKFEKNALRKILLAARFATDIDRFDCLIICG